MQRPARDTRRRHQIAQAGGVIPFFLKRRLGDIQYLLTMPFGSLVRILRRASSVIDGSFFGRTAKFPASKIPD